MAPPHLCPSSLMKPGSFPPPRSLAAAPDHSLTKNSNWFRQRSGLRTSAPKITLVSYRERILRLFLHKARLRQLENKVIQYYARVFKRGEERERGEGGGEKSWLVFFQTNNLEHTLSKHRHDCLSLRGRACPPFPRADRYTLGLTLPRIM